MQETIDFVVAVFTFKHSIEGDFNWVSVVKVEKLASRGDSGRVQR